MKLSDFLFNVGRPVAFYPGLVKALGSMKQAVFVCQMAYWKDKGDDPDGWIYKTSDEIETETSLTYKEQITVRAALVEKKALEERYARTEHLMYFRVNWDVINTIWDEHLTNGHIPKGKVAPDQRSIGILPKVSSLNSNTDTTSDTTHSDEKISFDEEKADIGWALLGGKKVTQRQLDKQKAIKDFEDMLEAQFRRFPLNWIAFDEKAKENFRRFLKALPEGESLEGFVNWWMSVEKRVSTPPYTLAIVMQRWPQAFAGKHKQAPAEPKPLETPFTKNLETWEYYERPSFDQILAAKKSSSEPLSE